MKTSRKLTLLASLWLAGLAGGSASGATLIVGDQYDVTGSGSGFALGSGVNSGINPPTTRLTGSAAPNLRYIKTSGNKADSAHFITNNTKLAVARISTDSSTLSLSSGSGAYDFGPALNVLAASTNNPAVYELTINIANMVSTVQRCSFAISSTPGTANNWDFAIQLYHAATGDTAYTLQKRVNSTIAGATLNSPIGTVGTFSNEVAFLIRVTDVGAESATFHSRVQVSIDGGASWIYDSSTDTASLPNGWGFPSASRYVYWDVAGGAGPVTYDNFTLNWISGPTSAPRTWTGGGADNNWSSGANWSSVVPSTGDALIFNGASRLVNTNDLSGLTVPWLAFNNGGFALYGNSLTNVGAITNLAGTNILGLELDWSSTASKIWSLAGGSELTLNNTTSVEVNGDHNLFGGGALRLRGLFNIGSVSTANPAFVINEGRFIIDGGTFSTRGGCRIGSLAAAPAGAQMILTNNATVTLTASGGNLRVGDSANPATTLLAVDHSTLSMSGGLLGLPYTAGATGVVAQVGGAVSGCRLSFSDAGAGQGTYTVKDGTLGAFQIRKNTSGGTASISFDNAVLTALSGASNTFMSGLNLAEIKAGGLTLDAQADVVIAQNLTGAGALIKSNYATLTLAGVNTYAGNTIVQGGKLILLTGNTCTTPIQVADYTELGVMVQTPGTTLTNASLSLGSVGSSTLSFDFGNFPSPTAPLMKVSTLSASGVVTINVANGLGLATGQIVLVDYDGAIGGNGFGAFQLANLPAGVSANLVNNLTNSSVDLNITVVPGFRWTGANSGDWDYITANWFSQQTGLASTYSDGFPVTFLDGAATGNINLNVYPSPAVLIVSNNTLPYVWSGGAITAPTLKKSGTASLIRIGGEADSIGGIELNQGSFVFSNLYDATFATVLTDASSGQGTFAKQGPGTLTVTSANSTYDGAVLIQEGIVKIRTDRALGSTSATIAITNGATLDLNDLTPGFEPVIVSGDGVNGQGAIIDSTTAGVVGTNLRDVTLAGDTTLGCPNGGRWDIRVRSSTGPGPGLRGNGYKLTKVGSGSVSIACQRTTTGYWQMNLGDVLVNEGTLTFAESLTPGNPSAALTISPGATLNLYDLGLTNPLARNITMTDAKISCGGAATDTNMINGSIQLTGANNIFADQANLIINSAMAGSGSVTFAANNPGTLVLNGINTYAGSTVVSNGTLAGIGVIAGNLFIYGGAIAPGWGGVGTLTVNGSVTLGATTLMELNPTNQVQKCDRLVAGGALAFGGTLQVVLASGTAPRAGDVYQLFNKGGTGAFTAINLPNLSGSAGLAWDTSKLAVNGTLIVTGPPTINSVGVNGGNFFFSGAGGTEGDTYYVLSSTNVAAPLSNWAPVTTNVFGPGGSFTFTNRINPAMPTAFFQLEVP